jgi:uncharacterized protein (TIGR03437 family)
MPATPAIHADADRDAGETDREKDHDPGAETLRSFSAARTTPSGGVPTERYFTAKHHIDAMPAVALGNWDSLGPGSTGGRTRSLLIHPTNPSIMYAGAVSGGVWKTTNSGASWTPLTDNQVLPFICTMAFDPTNPEIIYAGTGESYVPYFEGIRGLGILKTTDGGNTWTRLAATPDFYFVNKIRVSSTNPLHVYAATSTGVFSSLDGGMTWTQSLAAPPSGESANVPGCQDLAIRTDMPTDYLFASCTGGFYLAGGIWRNTDAAGSGTWTSVESSVGVIRIGLAIAPSNQSIVYALTSIGNTPQYTYLNALGAVLRSTSNGDPGSWTTQTSNADPTLLNTLLLGYPNDSCGGPTADAEKIGQGEYDLDIEVDPTNPDNVWVGGIDVFRSSDGGANWGIAGFGDVDTNVGGLHADQHMIIFPPGWNGTSNQTLYVVNDGGIWRTNNASAPVVTGTNAMCTAYNQTTGESYHTGATILWAPMNNSYVTTQFYGGAVFNGGGGYVGGTQDNGSLLGDAVHPNWTDIQGGDGGIWRIDPVDSSVFYGETPVLSRFTLGGAMFSLISNGIGEPFPTYPAYVLDPNNSLRLYFGGDSKLWRSDNQGTTWTAVASGGIEINAVAVAPSDSNHVVFGDQYGNIFTSSTALSATPSAGWTSSRPRVGWVSAIAFHPTDPNIVFAAYSTFDANPGDNHMYKSVDAGRSWTGIDNTGSATGLPDLPINSILIDPLNPSTVYLGTDMGIFVSADGGNTWGHDTSSFTNTVVNSLALDRGAGVTNLYAYTFGRGVWRVTLAGGGVPCTYSVSPTAVTVDAYGSMGVINVNTGAGCAWNAEVIQGYVQLLPPASGVGPGELYYQSAPTFYSTTSTSLFYVQGNPIQMTQAGADFPASNDTIATAERLSPFPYVGAASYPLTSDPSDPVHSCTGSADFQTSWWLFTPSSSGMVSFQGYAYRDDGIAGEGGFVITAYPASSVSTASELGCYTTPRSTTFLPFTGFQAPVSAGTSYLVELSYTTSAPTEGFIAVAPAAPAGSLTVTPATASLIINGKQQFTAEASNLSTQVVRWSISPAVGSINENGVYTAPETLAAPTNVKVTAVSVADNVTQATASITLTAAPVAIGAVTNAASFLADAVSPGEMVTVFGNGLGPATLAGAQLDANGTVSNLVSDTQILFDGTPAPIIYVQAGQTTVMVPYEVAGQASTQVVAVYQGQKSAPLTVPVGPSAPGIFTQDGKQGSILNFNADGSVTLNTTNARAAAGSTIEIYATGEGQTNPPGVDGILNNGPTLPKPVLPVYVSIGGLPAQVAYAGAAPGGVAGFMQLNVVIPSGLTAGAQSVVLTVGANMTPAFVTVWVQ